MKQHGSNIFWSNLNISTCNVFVLPSIYFIGGIIYNPTKNLLTIVKKQVYQLMSNLKETVIKKSNNNHLT